MYIYTKKLSYLILKRKIIKETFVNINIQKKLQNDIYFQIKIYVCNYKHYKKIKKKMKIQK